MSRALPDAVAVQTAEQVGAVSDLSVSALLGIRSGAVQALIELFFRNGFNVVASGERVAAKALTVVARQSFRIGDEPGFDRLDH